MSTTLDLSLYYSPHPLQQRVHASPAKVKCLKWGRRTGKSRGALGELLMIYVQSLDIEVPVSMVPPFHAWIVCPSYPQSRQVWSELMAFWPSAFIQHIHQDDLTIDLRGSEGRPWGLIEIKSAHNPDALQTAGLDFLWVMESQDIQDRAFERLLPTLRSPGRLGKAVYEGIPALYPTHWFARNCRVAEEGRDGYAFFHATAFDNPLLTEADRADIEADKELLPERVWRRMYLAEDSEDAGYFTNIMNCIGGDLLPTAVPGAAYVGGLDLGRKMDATVLHIMDSTDRRVVQHFYFDDGTDWVIQRETIVKLTQEWNVSRLVVDATGMGGDMFTSEMLEAGVPVEPYVFTQNSREWLLQGLVVALERGTVRFPNIPPLLRQLRAFQYKRLPSGRFKAEAPPGEHDDEVFALALALTACNEPPNVSPQGRSFRNSRYVPTQEEANQGRKPNSFGAQLMRQRKVAKMQARQEEAERSVRSGMIY